MVILIAPDSMRATGHIFRVVVVELLFPCLFPLSVQIRNPMSQTQW